MSYDTNIPRQCGLSGSSAIVIAALKCLVDFYEVSDRSESYPHPAYVDLFRDPALLQVAAVLSEIFEREQSAAVLISGALYDQIRLALCTCLLVDEKEFSMQNRKARSPRAGPEC